MHQWLKRTLLICAVFISTWLGVALYWNASTQLPTVSDVIIYLGLAPTGLVLAIWLTLKILAMATAKPAINTSTAKSPQADAPHVSSEQQDKETELILLASSIRAAHGDSVDELAQALLSNQARPVLDEELTDSDGYPVLSGRIQTVDEPAQHAALSSWIATQQVPEISWSTEQLRTLALGSEAFLDLMPQVLTHPMLPAYVSATPAQRQSNALPILQLLTLLPLNWSEQHRQLAARWFLHLIELQGWPAERICLRQAGSVEHAQPYLMLEQLSLQARQQVLPCLGLLIACESHIGEQSVLEWEQAGKLLTGNSEAGQIPGEGAAGLLFSDAGQAGLLRTDGIAKMHRPLQARREKSANARGRINTEILAELTRNALAATVIAAEKISFVTADTDHRSSRAGELIGMVSSTFPDLDLKTQCCKVAAACGFAGAVSSLTALALAHHMAATHAESALCISNQDEFECSALIVTPMVDKPALLPIPA